MAHRMTPIVLVLSLLLCLGLALALSLPAGHVQAGPQPALQSTGRPTLTPPPRLTATAAPTSTSTPAPRPKGGAIWLHCEGREPGDPPLQAVVQWLDGLGNWHDVEGWKGQVDGTDVVWYVDQKDFDTGPFRWIVSRGENDVDISLPFMLPGISGQVVRVAVQVSR